MTDLISSLGKSTAQLNASSDKIKTKPESIATPETEKSVKPNNDEFILSEAAESAMTNAEFDAEKVARIKEAIEQGNYPIDAQKVAESFAALESMIGGE